MARNLAVWLGIFIFVAPALYAQSEDFGKWVSLFGGKDTAGWVKAMAGQRDVPWKVEDGAMTNGQDGGMDLATADSFDNYELEIEYKLPRRRTPDFRGNSGVYLRAFYEVQIYDTHGVAVKDLSGIHAGSIYAGPVALANPQNPPGEWNKYKIRHIGQRITVWHNGVLVQDNVYVSTPTNGRMDKDPRTGAALDGTKGPIMLQGDHTQVWYRNIKIRPLCSPLEGWKPLWNGKDLSEFRSGEGVDVTKFWKLKDHAFWNENTGKDLWTKEDFGNFLVHYEYRCDKEQDGNSGFYLRDQWEIQIHKHQDPSPGGKHADGALYSMYHPMVKARNGELQWNQMDVKVDGMKIWVWQNGTLIHDGVECKRRTDSGDEAKTVTWSKKPFKLQGDHSKVWFANLFIKPLPDSR